VRYSQPGHARDFRFPRLALAVASVLAFACQPQGHGGGNANGGAGGGTSATGGNGGTNIGGSLASGGTGAGGTSAAGGAPGAGGGAAGGGEAGSGGNGHGGGGMGGGAGGSGGAGAGGTANAGGATGGGGAPATGGRTGTGGASATGGAASSGGTTGAGGGMGGATGTGGATGAGGTSAAGGNTGKGGATATGGTGNGGMPSAGGATGAGGSTGTPSCMNNKMDGDETGVDCGGSCPVCPNYKINAPNLKNSAASGCQGGPGFMCTRSMVFSPEFKQAAMDDWNSPDPPFVYGAVGHDKDAGGVDGNANNTCCQCYQLVFESVRDAVTGLPTPKPMIVQTFNTAAGGGKNFDLYMATGGEGANTAGCTAQYDQYPSVGQPNNGGIRPVNFPSQCATSNKYSLATVASATCQDQIASQCEQIRSSAAPVQADSQTSCLEANQPENLYHLNWSVRAKRVECPVGLTRVTGCKLTSQGLPQADPAAKDAASASGFATGYSTTTMQDCCRPTCGWNANVTQSGVAVDSGYGAFYTCDKAGNPS
jgi:hypothetical protein